MLLGLTAFLRFFLRHNGIQVSGFSVAEQAEIVAQVAETVSHTGGRAAKKRRMT
jgi:hypothetical protein